MCVHTDPLAPDADEPFYQAFFEHEPPQRRDPPMCPCDWMSRMNLNSPKLTKDSSYKTLAACYKQYFTIFQELYRLGKMSTFEECESECADKHDMLDALHNSLDDFFLILQRMSEIACIKEREECEMWDDGLYDHLLQLDDDSSQLVQAMKMTSMIPDIDEVCPFKVLKSLLSDDVLEWLSMTKDAIDDETGVRWCWLNLEVKDKDVFDETFNRYHLYCKIKEIQMILSSVFVYLQSLLPDKEKESVSGLPAYEW